MPYVVARPVQALLAAMIAGMVAACGTPSFAAMDGDMTPPAATATIEGVASYSERFALPPGAVFEANLEDVSRADARAHPRREQLWFTSDRIHRVLTRGAGNSVEIPLKGVRHHLDLWPDHVFHLRREWLGKGLVHADIGRWREDMDRGALVLHGGTEMPLQFEILGPDRLTGRSYPIEPGIEAERLQRAYLADVSKPGAALRVSFEGKITWRPDSESGQLEPVVTVERFIGTWPGQACPAPAGLRAVNTAVSQPSNSTEDTSR